MQILAAFDDLGNLLYLLLVLVLPALNEFGKWLRKRGKKSAGDDGEISIIEETKPGRQRRAPRYRVAKPMPLGATGSLPARALGITLADKPPVARQPHSGAPEAVDPLGLQPVHPRLARTPQRPAERVPGRAGRAKGDLPLSAAGGPPRPARPVPMARSVTRPDGLGRPARASKKRAIAGQAPAKAARQKVSVKRKGAKKKSIAAPLIEGPLVPSLDKAPEAVETQTIDEFDAVRRPSMADLRRAIVMNEVLGQPLALRDPHSLE